MLNDDIVLAQRVVGLAESNLVSDKVFHNTSGIYIKSNERIECYQKYLENRERLLSVIASGDQILNCILGGSRIIDAFDISVFPKYFLELKMAAIKALTREEYIEFFYGSIRPDEKYEDMYSSIRVCLTGDALEFWDSLFDYYEWYDIYNSTLFSTEPVIAKHAIDQNKYLDEDNYNKLKRVLDEVKIKYFDGDILDIKGIFRDRYDLVYLSNIIYYSDIDEYRELLGKFNLTDQGIILTYLYEVTKRVMEYFKDKKSKIERFKTGTSGVLISHK